MNDDNIDYILGYTNERITEDGTIKSIVKDINIFDQFPKINNNLFCQPKLALMKAPIFYKTGVGHHGINNNYTCTTKIKSRTNHFRWTLQGKKRMENWIKLWESGQYKGWMDINKYKKQLEVMEINDLLKY